MKVSVYIRSGDISPSSYYRIIQYARKWNYDTNIYCAVPMYIYTKRNDTIFTWKKYFWNPLYYFCAYIHIILCLIKDLIRNPDCIIILREISPKKCFFPIRNLEKRLLRKTKNVIWDFDDDIFVSKEIDPKEILLLSRFSQTIFVTHDGLKSKLQQDVQKKVRILPTTDGDFCKLNIDELIIQRKCRLKKEIELIWIATQASISNLMPIIPWLDIAAKNFLVRERKKLILNVVCNCKIETKVKFLHIINTKWSRDIIQSCMSRAMIGIMPLSDTEFNKGKGGFKLIQYMAVGIPVIASPIGYNNNIVKNTFGEFACNKEEWEHAILNLSKSPSIYINKSYAAYLEYKKIYSYEQSMDEWIKAIKKGV